MSAWTPRRFWTTASVVPAEGGFAVVIEIPVEHREVALPVLENSRGVAVAS